ncbi:hypothetical protein CW743_13755 [Staphylococcus shinii]|nr:hypothetical protein CW743_13755 [Staphylococcus shinii]
MKHRFLEAIKDCFFIVISTLLNYINPDISFNKYWSKLGNLDWVNIYNSPNLNGLIVLGIISFIYDMFFSKENEKNLSRKVFHLY